MSDECRKAFEEWCKKNDLPWKRDYTDFFYTYHKTEVAWNTWQAAWSARGDGWVSAKKRLPKEYASVVCFVNGDPRILERRWDVPGYEENYNPYWYWDDPNDDGQDIERDSVTHWQPLTLPPKGDE